MSFPDELSAFRAYAEVFPNNCLLLVDTYDTLTSGVPNAITVFNELRAKGYEPTGIRLDQRRPRFPQPSGPQNAG